MSISRRSIAGVAIFIVAAATLGALSPGPALATSPPWEPDPNSATPYGNIVFYDAAGNVVTGGSDLTHIADYAAATSDPDAGANKATLYFAAPDHTKVTGLWATNQQSASTTFPTSGAPGPIDGLTEPVVTLPDGAACLICSIGGFVKDATAGYADIYQVRLVDSGTGGAGSGTHYWSTDVMVDEGAGTWTQVYPFLEPPKWLPVQSGPHRIGSTDQCLASFDTADTVTYAWNLDGAPIGGATGVNYTPPEGSFGKDLSCTVMASNGAGDVEATSIASTLGVGPALVPTTKPFLYNGTNKRTIQHGKVESVNNGKWSPAATSFKYQWYVGKKKIAGATSNTFKPGASLVGKTISCLVTAKRLHWTDGSFKTAGVKVT